MGLDQYLFRMARYGKCQPKDVIAINAYFDWKQEKENGKQKYTLKEWCGVSYNELKRHAIKFYETQRTLTYSDWDKEHQYPWIRCYDEAGYWRKANAIHKWFVDNVQDGEDDCEYYEVSKKQLEQLLHICKLIKEKCRMKVGKIENGQTFENGKWKTIYDDGEFIENPEIAEEYLPTQGGFFFGGTDYDQYYMEDIESTIEILTNVLAETDFDKQMIAYHSSW